MTSRVIENKKPGYILRISQNICANDQTNTMMSVSECEQKLYVAVPTFLTQSWMEECVMFIVLFAPMMSLQSFHYIHTPHKCVCKYNHHANTLQQQERQKQWGSLYQGIVFHSLALLGQTGLSQ